MRKPQWGKFLTPSGPTYPLGRDHRTGNSATESSKILRKLLAETESENPGPTIRGDPLAFFMLVLGWRMLSPDAHQGIGHPLDMDMTGLNEHPRPRLRAG